MSDPFEYHQKLLAKEPLLRYHEGEDFAEWQKRAYERLFTLLGMDKFERTAPALEIEYDQAFDGGREIRFTFASEDGYRVPCHLLVPEDAEKPLPVMICLQGHSRGMHISLGRPKYFPGDVKTIAGGDRDFAVRTIKEGFCALVLEQRGFGECGGDADGPKCHLPSTSALLLGRTTIGERVWDISRAIDVLCEYFKKEVDAENIWCMGNSGGGTATFYAACIDRRIKAAMPSCAVCSYLKSIAACHHCICNFIPSIGIYFDMGDLGGLIAPRKLVVVCGREDHDFNIEGVLESYELIRRAYSAADAPQNCELVEGQEGHRFYADLAWPVFRKIVGR